MPLDHLQYTLELAGNRSTGCIAGEIRSLASAYTPGLTVSADIIVRRVRRLPIKGEVLTTEGVEVTPETVVARALLPGPLQTMKLAEKLNVEAKDVLDQIKLRPGDTITKGQLIAETKGFLGRFKQQITSDFEGTIETISEVTGNALVREASIPVEIKAYIKGKIAEVMPDEGAIVETRASMVQGIFGVGAERTGIIRVAVKDAAQILEASDIFETDKGKILIGGSGVSAGALAKATEVGVNGIVAGGIKDSDLIKFLGYDIGVAITGQENISLTLVVTEGFGFLSMAERTFKLLQSLSDKEASINGATQIRAGVIRPELIVPLAADAPVTETDHQDFSLSIGTPIRVIREPYFGKLAKVSELPAQLMTVDSGTEVRVLKALLDSGEEVTVPRANVEILAN